MATFYGVDGLIIDVQPKDPKHGFQEEELCELLDCDSVAMLPMGDNAGMYVDAEGGMIGSPINSNATNMWYGVHSEARTINGDALYVTRKKWQS